MASNAPFWGDAANSHTLLSAKSPNRYHLARLLKKHGMRQIGERITTLLADSTPASTASVIISRVQAVVGNGFNQGGVRTIEAKEHMDNVANPQPTEATPDTARAVAAADVTDLNLLVSGGADSLRSPSTYPTDASGNGGGGKVGSF